MSATVDALCQTLAEMAPIRLAESWDNVGLLTGDRSAPVQRVLTCLTVTPTVVDEAIEKRVDLIVTHHPLPFRPLSKITCDSITGRLLWRLISAQVAIYSAHTAFDSAKDGINQRWAESLSLNDIGPLIPPVAAATDQAATQSARSDDKNDLGSGRCGTLSNPLAAREVIVRCGRSVSDAIVCRAVGPLDRMITRVGFACGSGGSFVAAAHRRGCELLITGEATFHQCLEAESLGITLGLLGHYHSERFAMEQLAEQLGESHPSLSIWPSQNESDPITVL